MTVEQPDKVVFPADIHQVAADIRRQALQHPDRDPVVRRAPAPRKKAAGTTAKRKKTTAKRQPAKAKKKTKDRGRKTTRGRRR